MITGYQPRSGVIYVAHSVSCGNVISLCSAAERRHIEPRLARIIKYRRSAAGWGWI